MKWVIALVVASSLLVVSADAQNSRVREPDAKNGQPVAGQPKRPIRGRRPVGRL